MSEEKKAGKMVICKGCDRRMMQLVVIAKHNKKRPSDWCPEASRSCSYLLEGE